jgi:hypothetical protein
MTAQLAERLHYDGQEWPMLSLPLESYFAHGGQRPALQDVTTALWRRYVGSWELVGGRLYLVGLQGQLADGGELTLERLFPGFPNRVFAHWFSGDLRLTAGRRVNYVHQGFQSTYERELWIAVRRGVIAGQCQREHSHAAAGAAKQAVTT